MSNEFKTNADVKWLQEKRGIISENEITEYLRSQILGVNEGVGVIYDKWEGATVGKAYMAMKVLVEESVLLTNNKATYNTVGEKILANSIGGLRTNQNVVKLFEEFMYPEDTSASQEELKRLIDIGLPDERLREIYAFSRFSMCTLPNGKNVFAVYIAAEKVINHMLKDPVTGDEKKFKIDAILGGTKVEHDPFTGRETKTYVPMSVLVRVATSDTVTGYNFNNIFI